VCGTKIDVFMIHGDRLFRTVILTICIGLATPIVSAFAAERPILAVFEIEDRSKSLNQEQLTNLTDYLASLLVEGGYDVVSREQIRERLRDEQKESYKKCYEQSCQIELGRELAAQKVLSTRILPIGGKCMVTVSLYNLKRATAELAANAEAECNELSLFGALKLVAKRLCAPLQSKPKEPEAGTLNPDEKKKRLEEELRAKAEAEVRIRMETEARIKAEREARQRAEAEERRKQEEARRQAQLAEQRRKAEAARLAEQRRLQQEAEERRKKLELDRRIGTRPLMLDDMIPGFLLDAVVHVSWGTIPEGTYLKDKDYVSWGLLFRAGMGDEAKTYSIGLALALYMADIDSTKASPIGFGNPAVTFKYRKCFDVGWSLCIGTSTLLSFGLLEGSDLAENVESGGDTPLEGDALKQMQAEAARAVFRAAAIGVQDPSTARYEHMSFRPLAIFTASNGDFFAQANTGLDLYTPLMNVDRWKDEYDTRVGLALRYGVATGYRVTDSFVPVAEFNGWTSLIGKKTETALFVNIGPTLQMSSDYNLFLLVSVPLTDAARYGGDVQFQVRVAGDIF